MNEAGVDVVAEFPSTNALITFHRVSELFPPIETEQYEAFRADIQAHGLREPIVVYKGTVIDGRHRLRACEELGITPKFREFDGAEADVLNFVLSENLQRRHLSAGQRAALGAKIEEYLSKFAKARQGARTDIVEKIPPSDFGKARDQAAKQVHVNPHYITDFKAVERELPVLADEIANGTMNLHEVRKLIKNGRSLNDEPPIDNEPNSVEQPPQRLLKRNATLVQSWIWPEGVEEFVKSRIKGHSLHVCAGTSELGDVRVDLEPKAPGVIQADMYSLPFPDESFDTVISDPPWKINWFDRWKPFFELVRVCKVGGQIIFNSYYLPWSKQVKLLELWMRQDERFANLSAISVFERFTDKNPE